MQDMMIENRGDASAGARWADALAAREAAKTAHEVHSETVWSPICEAVERAAPRPDLWFDIEARSGQVARFYVDTDRLNAFDDHISPTFRNAAAAVRDAWLPHAAARAAYGWHEAEEENEALCAAQGDAEENLVLTPAPDVGALLWKLHYCFGPGICPPGGPGPAISSEWTHAIMVDVAALLGAPPVHP